MRTLGTHLPTLDLPASIARWSALRLHKLLWPFSFKNPLQDNLDQDSDAHREAHHDDERNQNAGDRAHQLGDCVLGHELP